jgi:GDP-L-fucose synthase
MSAWRKFAKKENFDYVFHLAARAPSGRWLNSNPATAWHQNTLINANVLEAHRRYLPEAKLVSTLSSAIYPDTVRVNYETDKLIHDPSKDLAGYSSAKQSVIVAQEAYRRQYGINAVSVVLASVYGPAPSKTLNKKFLEQISQKFYDALKTNASVVTLWGSGMQKRDMLYIDDAVAGLLLAASEQCSQIVNLGSGYAVSIEEISKKIAKIIGYHGKVEFNPFEYEGAMERTMSIQRARVELGWEPKISLDEGLIRTLKEKAYPDFRPC